MNRCKRIREEHNVTIREMARLLGCDEQTIYKHESTDNLNSLNSYLMAYANYFSVSPDYLNGNVNHKDAFIDRDRNGKLTVGYSRAIGEKDISIIKYESQLRLHNDVDRYFGGTNKNGILTRQDEDMYSTTIKLYEENNDIWGKNG